MNSAPPTRRVDDLGGLERGLADVAGDELGPVALDEVPLGQHADRAVDPGDEPGDRGLAGAGIADEHEVAGHVGGLQPVGAAQRLDAEHLRLVPDLGLDRLEPDERVELGEQLLERLRAARARLRASVRARRDSRRSPLRVGGAVRARSALARMGGTNSVATAAGALLAPRPAGALPSTVAVPSAEIVSSPSDAAAIASSASARA